MIAGRSRNGRSPKGSERNPCSSPSARQVLPRADGRPGTGAGLHRIDGKAPCWWSCRGESRRSAISSPTYTSSPMIGFPIHARMPGGFQARASYARLIVYQQELKSSVCWRRAKARLRPKPHVQPSSPPIASTAIRGKFMFQSPSIVVAAAISRRQQLDALYGRRRTRCYAAASARRSSGDSWNAST